MKSVKINVRRLFCLCPAEKARPGTIAPAAHGPGWGNGGAAEKTVARTKPINNHLSRSDSGPRLGLASCGLMGFTLVELMAVIIIFGALAMVAVPEMMNSVRAQRTRGEVMNAATLMRQARLKASTSQKPVRVVLDCSGQDCQMRSQLAQYDQGEVIGWEDVAGTKSFLNPTIKAVSTTPVGPNPDGEDTPAGYSWIIFMPGGRAYSNPRPFNLFFYNTTQPSTPQRPGWSLSVSNDSGRVSLNRQHQNVN